MTHYHTCNYYDVPAASHSGCKSIGETTQIDPARFEFGSMVHAILEGQQVPDATEQAIKAAAAVVNALRPYLGGLPVLHEHEIYRVLDVRLGDVVWEKSKLDYLQKGRLVADAKTCSCTSESAFFKICHSMGYYQQIVRYMHMARVPIGILIGVNKHTAQTFLAVVKHGGGIWEQYWPLYQEANKRWLEYNYRVY